MYPPVSSVFPPFPLQPEEVLSPYIYSIYRWSFGRRGGDRNWEKRKKKKNNELGARNRDRPDYDKVPRSGKGI
jgi:hypothetical protein